MIGSRQANLLASHKRRFADLIDAALSETVQARTSVVHVSAAPPDQLAVAPDSGMKYLPRCLARAKLGAMTAGAQLARDAARDSRPPPQSTRTAE